MKLTELGFDYSNLSSCNVKRKNFIVALIFLILVVCFLPIFIIFFAMYLTETPLETNGSYIYYGDPAYQTFFVSFLSVFGSLTIASLVIGLLNLFGKPKTYFYMHQNALTFNTFYYIYNRLKHEEIYLSEKIAFVYNSKYNKTFEVVNPNEIRELYCKFIFWIEFDTLENYKIVNKKNKTVLKYTTDKSKGSRVRLRKVYSFSNDINIVPVSVVESISYASYGNRNNQNYFKYYFEDINRQQTLDIHPEIKKRISLID